MTTISAGYRLTVSSWENDGDNYNTKVLDGLSREECAFYVDLCKLLQGSTTSDRLANLYEPSDAELKMLGAALQGVARNHSTEITQLENIDDIELVSDQLMDVLYDLGLTGAEFHTRVCSKWMVEHLPVDVTLTEVTEEFK